ncbi:hypothetical protein ZIOFF_001340 [Zingiber officinale]|uniref:CP-type G domain-containing protein n=1 Tax=Zingiber officinale TaxID=94328 RepID=A0A8J5I5P7_ZINOF|nr:hypothetical protein ZIOFF_001340 [Zingiber officinale]
MATPFTRRLDAVARELASKKGSGRWCASRIAAAERAILDRIPLVDLVLEVRDARIPTTSAFESLRKACCSHKQVIVLNKVDLANDSLTKKWIENFKNQNYPTCGLNAHNKDSVKELLRIVRAKLKELKFGQSKYTATILLAGIPNVGKSSIANNMHQIGRIGAAEKGKLKHAVVSPYPGETEDISSYKFGSHPNLYVLDTPGILRPEIAHYHSGAKLALTGAIKDNLLDEHELARYFLAILNLSEEYKRWVTPKDTTDSMPGSLEKHRRKGQYASDFTQDFIVKDVRQTLFDCISSFEGDLENECDMERLIESQIKALQVPLKASLESSAHRHSTVATKLLKLYRTGRLGHYTLDLVKDEQCRQCHVHWVLHFLLLAGEMEKLDANATVAAS